jgi:hypothetical protein
VVTASLETVATTLLALVREDAKQVTAAPPVYKVFYYTLYFKSKYVFKSQFNKNNPGFCPHKFYLDGIISSLYFRVLAFILSTTYSHIITL